MERIIDRFDKYLKSKGLNDNQVTLQLGWSVGSLGKSRKENRDLSRRSVDAILKFYIDLEPIWLITGSGNMIKRVVGEIISGIEPISIDIVLDIYKNQIQDLNARNIELQLKIDELNKENGRLGGILERNENHPRRTGNDEVFLRSARKTGV